MSYPNFQVQIQFNGKDYQLAQTGVLDLDQHGQLTLQKTQVLSGERWQVFLKAETNSTPTKLTLTCPISLKVQDKVFCNGFQSWSESREMDFSEQLPDLRSIAKPLMGYYGDYHFPWINRGKGHLHSWSWTYLKSEDTPTLFLGSLKERDGFSLFQFDAKQQQLVIIPDLAGQSSFSDTPLLDIWVHSGDVDQAYNSWFKLMDIPPATAPRIKGWTSWYQFYTKINFPVLQQTLAGFKAEKLALDYFQIDDGYQTWVGDWLDLKKGFVGQMPHLVQEIKSSGYQPGIWLAPYVAAKRSKLVKEHPEWLQRDAKGKPLKAGYNPLWKGHFYALDPLHPGLQNYLAEVFRTVIEDWGFAFIKLDFLYAACIQPLGGFNRGQVCHQSLSYLRKLAGEVPLLGCGVPLALGFGLFDYCRIGADIHLRWEHQLLRWFRHRERVSTQIALRTVIGRQALDGRAWRNDPDVVILRDQDQHLTRIQRQTIARINAVCGSQIFQSDRLDQWEDWQHELYQEAIDLNQALLIAIKPLAKDVYQIEFEDKAKKEWVLIANLSKHNYTGQLLKLGPYASKILSL